MSDTANFAACDRCYSKKLKCDRKRPCERCAKIGVECSRSPDLRRHVRPAIAKRQRQTSSSQASPAPARSVAKHSSVSETSTPRLDDDSSHLLHSTAEAQELIEHQLTTRGPYSPQASRAFGEALKSIDEILSAVKSTSELQEKTYAPVSDPTLDINSIPPAELLQWAIHDGMTSNESMLNILHDFTIAGGDNDCRLVADNRSIFDMMMIISVQSFARIVEQVLGALSPETRDPCHIVIVNTMTAYFIAGKATITYVSKLLEPSLIEKAERYIMVAQANIGRLPWLLTANNLVTLQAMILGSYNAQELGQPLLCWRLSSAASHLCLVLDLHKNRNALALDPETAQEAQACFLYTYIMDKGLSANLCKPSSLEDSNLEAHITQPSAADEPHPSVDFMFILVGLARVQSVIISDLQSGKGGTRQGDTRHATVRKLEADLKALQAKMDELRLRPCHENVANEWINWPLVDFSFYTVLTSVLRYDVSRGAINPKCVQSARRSLKILHTTRKPVNSAAEGIRQVAFFSWTLFFYPFTAFFVLFCNFVQVSDPEDLALMQSMVSTLTDLEKHYNYARPWNGGPLISKLRNLCGRFLNVAETMPSNANAITSKQQQQTLPTPENRSQQQQLNETDTMSSFFDMGFPASDSMWQLLHLEPSLDLLNGEWSNI